MPLAAKILPHNLLRFRSILISATIPAASEHVGKMAVLRDYKSGFVRCIMLNLDFGGITL